MKTPEGRRNAVPLDEVLSILAKSTRVESRLRTKFGLKESELALEMVRQARLAGDLGDRVHDFLSDEIANEAEDVLTLYAWGSSAGAYGVSVMGYEGVFFVQAPDFDDVGYFTTVNDVESYIQVNWWGELKESPEDWKKEDEDGEEKD